MSTSMLSDPIIKRESGRCQRKPFLNLWVWAGEGQLPISAYQAIGDRNRAMNSEGRHLKYHYCEPLSHVGADNVIFAGHAKGQSFPRLG
jgi:hypothetical protein